MCNLLKHLNELQDLKYRDFQSKLIPTVDKEKIIGVKTPALKALAKEFSRSAGSKEFLDALPHNYFEENQIQGFVISQIKDFDECIKRVQAFLPYIDNWATCDQTSPVIFKKHRKELFPYIKEWLKSGHTYTIRFAIGMLMQHFLDEDFDRNCIELVVAVKSDEYYVNMEIAWYMATALAKQWDESLPFLSIKYLDKWTLNKSIQKARESRRISKEKKEKLLLYKFNG